jgi:hypothetical protein
LVYVGGYRNDNFHGVGFKIDVEGDGLYCGAPPALQRCQSRES